MPAWILISIELSEISPFPVKGSRSVLAGKQKTKLNTLTAPILTVLYFQQCIDSLFSLTANGESQILKVAILVDGITFKTRPRITESDIYLQKQTSGTHLKTNLPTLLSFSEILP